MAKANQKKKKNVKVEATGEAHIQASFNNLIISLTNNAGQVISWSSAGKMGFKGSKKNTPYAAQLAAEDAAKENTVNPEIIRQLIKEAKNKVEKSPEAIVERKGLMAKGAA